MANLDFNSVDSPDPELGGYLEFVDSGWFLAYDEDDVGLLAFWRELQDKKNRSKTTSPPIESAISATAQASPSESGSGSGSQMAMDWLPSPVNDISLALDLDLDLDIDLNFSSFVNDTDPSTEILDVDASSTAENRGPCPVASLTLPFPFPSPWSTDLFPIRTTERPASNSPWPLPEPLSSPYPSPSISISNSHDQSRPPSISSASASGSAPKSQSTNVTLSTHCPQREPQSAQPTSEPELQPEHPRQPACDALELRDRDSHEDQALRDALTSAVTQALTTHFNALGSVERGCEAPPSPPPFDRRDQEETLHLELPLTVAASRQAETEIEADVSMQSMPIPTPPTSFASDPLLGFVPESGPIPYGQQQYSYFPFNSSFCSCSQPYIPLDPYRYHRPSQYFQPVYGYGYGYGFVYGYPSSNLNPHPYSYSYNTTFDSCPSSLPQPLSCDSDLVAEAIYVNICRMRQRLYDLQMGLVHVQGASSTVLARPATLQILGTWATTE